MKCDFVVHGFRSAFRDWCADNGHDRELSEAALAHTRQGVEAAVRRTGTSVRVVKSLDDLPGAVAAAARPNDLVITLGAGSIGSIADRILEELSHRANSPNTEGAGGWA